MFYATTDEGTELPIVDVTHPQFALSIGPEEQQQRIEEWRRQQAPFRRLPRWLRAALTKLFFKKSVLGRALLSADGTYLTGLRTYLMKLGPDHVDAVSDHPIDKRLAASLPMLSIRLRMQDVATLLAEFLTPELLAAPGRPLHLLNIAGGPTMDSLNALLLMRRNRPECLEGRRVVITVLDLDTHGPAFGARALEALRGPGGPLQGLQIELIHRSYDWSRATDLAPVLEAARSAKAIVGASSEGGLFDYGSDQEIIANLEMLRDTASVVVGSVTRADELMKSMLTGSKMTLRQRGHAAFAVLAQRAGWNVARVIERPMSDQVALKA
jgi:hypothetical protein